MMTVFLLCPMTSASSTQDDNQEGYTSGLDIHVFGKFINLTKDKCLLLKHEMKCQFNFKLIDTRGKIFSDL